MVEFDHASGKAFGWARLGADDSQGEWGYIDLPALESFRSARGLPNFVERDLSFTPAAGTRGTAGGPPADALPGRGMHNVPAAD
ncbi:hypothetical protein ACFQ3Z_16280 [Streptomyces nogalater]